jgi:hypothetical protein
MVSLCIIRPHHRRLLISEWSMSEKVWWLYKSFILFNLVGRRCGLCFKVTLLLFFFFSRLELAQVGCVSILRLRSNVAHIVCLLLGRISEEGTARFLGKETSKRRLLLTSCIGENISATPIWHHLYFAHYIATSVCTYDTQESTSVEGESARDCRHDLAPDS